MAVKFMLQLYCGDWQIGKSGKDHQHKISYYDLPFTTSFVAFLVVSLGSKNGVVMDVHWNIWERSANNKKMIDFSNNYEDILFPCYSSSIASLLP